MKNKQKGNGNKSCYIVGSATPSQASFKNHQIGDGNICINIILNQNTTPEIVRFVKKIINS